MASSSQKPSSPERTMPAGAARNGGRPGPQAVPSSEQPRPEFERLLDSEEAAALLKIHPKTLQRMARRNEIAGVQIGKLWRFRASALNRWLLDKIAG